MAAVFLGVGCESTTDPNDLGTVDGGLPPQDMPADGSGGPVDMREAPDAEGPCVGDGADCEEAVCCAGLECQTFTSTGEPDRKLCSEPF